MYFSKTCHDVHVEVSDGSTTLYVSARRQDWMWNDTSINLDEFIGNDDGSFSLREPGSEVDAFSQSARDIDLDHRSNGTWLVARLARSDGSYDGLQRINLDHHITNNNGRLKWISF